MVINGTEHIGQKKILSALSKLNENARYVIPTANSPLDHQKVSTLCVYPHLIISFNKCSMHIFMLGKTFEPGIFCIMHNVYVQYRYFVLYAVYSMYTVCMSPHFMNITIFQVVLMANIPSLSCPAALKSGFRVYLVDNPGLGELNQLATRMAELAVATSTAYIYTMDCESIELKEHAEVLEVLLEKDSGECLFVSNNSTPHYPVMIHVSY